MVILAEEGTHDFVLSSKKLLDCLMSLVMLKIALNDLGMLKQ